VLILACGTSYYSGLTAKYWLESIAKIPTQVEIASEYRYRESVPNPRQLVLVISQSGETADTLAALKHAQSLGHTHTLAVCNVATSAMVRRTEMQFLTRAGTEIGVASTKAFTTQLVALFVLAATLGKLRGHVDAAQEAQFLKQLRHLPAALNSVLALEPQIIAWSEEFARKENALFLGRGLHYPIALEGALKLKEISYIHAEAYPAGDSSTARSRSSRKRCRSSRSRRTTLLEKLKSNMQEVRARRRAVRVRRRRHADRQRRRPARDPDAGALRAAVADPARGAAAAARVSHRVRARHRRRQAAQPREVGDGGISNRRSAARRADETDGETMVRLFGCGLLALSVASTGWAAEHYVEVWNPPEARTPAAHAADARTPPYRQQCRLACRRQDRGKARQRSTEGFRQAAQAPRRASRQSHAASTACRGGRRAGRAAPGRAARARPAHRDAAGRAGPAARAGLLRHPAAIHAGRQRAARRHRQPLRGGDAIMEAQTYHGYQIWGHAILQQDEILQPERFAASGTITQNNRLVEASGVLGVFDTEDEAREAGLEWARAWIDGHQ
jgi:hypothetical protein